MKILKRGDIILGVSIIAAALVLMLISAHPGRTSAEGGILVAVIKEGDTVTHTVELDNVESQIKIIVGGKFNEVILVEKGRIRFESADCPDKVCVNTGWLEKPGDMAVCIPNRTLIKIERLKSGKGNEDDVDIRAY